MQEKGLGLEKLFDIYYIIPISFIVFTLVFFLNDPV
jgi:hypothetical protein